MTEATAATTDTPHTIEDVQARTDARQIPINRVGIRGIRHPLRILTADGDVQHTVATASLCVSLPHNRKGTHMSRFVGVLDEQREPISTATLPAMLRRMVRRLEADEGFIELHFPLFLRKHAPVSGVASLMDYDVGLEGVLRGSRLDVRCRVVVPVTSLCPCSKSIAEYGAHNQRSHITVSAHGEEAIIPEALIRMVEAEASCELFGLLKRSDEKYVTERAYDNPKFVEDVVRDVAARLDAEPSIRGYSVAAENFESIHNHSAYALIEREKDQQQNDTGGYPR